MEDELKLKMELIARLSEMINLLSEHDYDVDYVVSRYLWNLYTDFS